MRNRQRGMTMWSATFTISVLAFIIFLAFKLIPAYSNDFTIRTALERLVKHPDIGSMSKAEMADSLNKRFVVEYVDNVDPMKQLAVEKRGRNKVIRYGYDVVIPLFYNVSVLLDFEHVYEVPSVE
jgi:hypothetical protein